MKPNRNERIALKELVDNLRDKYSDNLSRVLLYGSFARGDATRNSDIDIMVVLKNIKNYPNEKKKIGEIRWHICYEYDLLIPITIKTEQEYLTKNSPLLLNVRREGIQL
ncbi:MAG: nucleotidyltransferase domain-containing protein [Elusimicrobiota bacterium]